VHMGPSATAMERRAEHQAMREGRDYEPVTMVGQHNAAVREKRGLGHYIERGTEWLREHGVQMRDKLHGLAATLNRAVSADQRERERARQVEAERPREAEREREVKRQLDLERSRDRDRGWSR
ncbi:MAG: hypothetical protein QHC89_30315, partial [Bosea sp. (in: a-proteobacteria)]|nr:hypothetical protein [Bosea sp. (in: a-proteobacteria)]